MDRLSFLADEHVPNVVITTLRSNSYDVERAKDELGEESVDAVLLDMATDREMILLTNDRDFIRIGNEATHAGIVIYAAQELGPGAFIHAIDRLNRHFTPDAMQNNIEWLEDWLS